MSYSEPLLNQPKVLLLAVGVGVLLCIIYIVLQSICCLAGEGQLVCFFADGIFCVAFMLVSFFFMVIYAGGRVRLHLILGEAAGFFLFYFSVGRYIYNFLRQLALILRRLLMIILKPYAFIFSSLRDGIRAWSGKIALIFTKTGAESEVSEKKKKKFNLFDKIHLKNPDKSV